MPHGVLPAYLFQSAKQTNAATAATIAHSSVIVVRSVSEPALLPTVLVRTSMTSSTGPMATVQTMAKRASLTTSVVTSVGEAEPVEIMGCSRDGYAFGLAASMSRRQAIDLRPPVKHRRGW
jgi:uncharacterized ParB-like nuclease family protein